MIRNMLQAHFHFSAGFLILCTIVLGLQGCMESDQDQKIVIAKVGDRTLSLDEIKEDVSSNRYATDSLQVIRQYRNDWINRQLKVREAKRLGLDTNPEVQRRIERARESILADVFNQSVYLDISSEEITRSEAQAYYESNKEKFLLAERHVRYRHMIAENMSDAQNARSAIQRGRTWSRVANLYAVDPPRAIAHSRRHWPISEASREYEPMNNFLQVIGISEISPIRRIGDQYHFVQLLESRESGEHPRIDWIVDEISKWLILDRRRKHLRSMEQSLFLKAEANNKLQIFDISQPDQQIEIVTDTL